MSDSTSTRWPTCVSSTAPDFELPAVQLRISLDRILAEHAFLSIEAMRIGVPGGAEFEVAAEVLEQNTVELVELVEVAYGRDAAVAFAEQWRNHLAYLVDYTRAVADGDDDARDLASSQLETYIVDFSALLAEANPDLPPDVVEGLIEEHGQQHVRFQTAEHLEPPPISHISPIHRGRRHPAPIWP